VTCGLVDNNEVCVAVWRHKARRCVGPKVHAPHQLLPVLPSWTFGPAGNSGRFLPDFNSKSRVLCKYTTSWKLWCGLVGCLALLEVLGRRRRRLLTAFFFQRAFPFRDGSARASPRKSVALDDRAVARLIRARKESSARVRILISWWKLTSDRLLQKLPWRLRNWWDKTILQLFCLNSTVHNLRPSIMKFAAVYM